MFKEEDLRITVIISRFRKLNPPGLLTFGVSKRYVYRYYELVPFCLLGVIGWPLLNLSYILGGLLGALFVKLNVRVNKWRRDYLRNNFAIRLIEVILNTPCLSLQVVVVVLICVMLTFGIPTFFHCTPTR